GERPQGPQGGQRQQALKCRRARPLFGPAHRPKTGADATHRAPTSIAGVFLQAQLRLQSRVSMLEMKRICIYAVAATTLGALSAPAMASAQIIELGATSTPLVAPTCPTGISQSDCKIVLTQ